MTDSFCPSRPSFPLTVKVRLPLRSVVTTLTPIIFVEPSA
jgi:hypothetical protein